MEPLVSILIPAYNAERWIAESLESALIQTWSRKEIIVVDDGSTDRTVSVARRFAAPNVKVISQSHGGACLARNRALYESLGDYIQFLDADDLLAGDKIERQLSQVRDITPRTLFTSEWALFRRNRLNRASFNPDPLWNDMSPVDWLVCSWEGHHMMHPAAWLVPRAIADEVGGWNESLTLDDDSEYFCRVVLAASNIKFCLGAKTYYRFGYKSSLSQTNNRIAWESKYHSIELSAEHLLRKEDSARTRHACATRFQRFIFEFGPYALDLQQMAKSKVKKYGGSNVQPFGRVMFRVLKQLLGWKSAKAIQVFAYRYGFII